MNRKDTINNFFDLIKTLVETNLLWFIFSSPFFGYVYYILWSDSKMNTIQIIIVNMLGLFALLPATTALFAVLRKRVKKEKISIVKYFFKYYQENYQQSWMGGILFSIFWSLYGYSFLNYSSINSLINILFIILAIGLLNFTLNYFSMIVHMEVSIYAAIRSAFVLMVGGNIYTLIEGATVIGILFLSFKVAPVLLLFFTGASIAYIHFKGFNKLMFTVLYYKDQTQQEENSEN